MITYAATETLSHRDTQSQDTAGFTGANAVNTPEFASVRNELREAVGYQLSALGSNKAES